jgi:LPXTG-motif cell wall-anchored protein
MPSTATSASNIPADQNNASTAAPADQNVDRSANSEQLPQTASPLPLLGLLGLGSLLAGLVARKK